VHGHAQREPEGVRGHQADAQPGVRAGADADDDPGDGVQPQTCLGEHPVDRREQQLAVAAGVHLARRGDDVVAVVQRDGDGGGGGIQSEQEHANSLRLPRPGHGRTGRPVTYCYGHVGVRE
jgi:hypothetical protein